MACFSHFGHKNFDISIVIIEFVESELCVLIPPIYLFGLLVIIIILMFISSLCKLFDYCISN